MGVDYKAVLYVGKEFETEGEAIDFYQGLHPLSDSQWNIIQEDGFQEFLSCQDSVCEGEMLNLYTSHGFVLGFDVSYSIYDPDYFADVVKGRAELWNTLFPNEPCHIINTVKVY